MEIQTHFEIFSRYLGKGIQNRYSFLQVDEDFRKVPRPAWSSSGQVYTAAWRGEPEARLLVLGDGPLVDVAIEETGRIFSLGPERQRLADQACQRYRERGQTVEPNPVYRVLDWTLGERFTLRADRGDYSQVVGTKSHPEWGLKAQVLAVCCATECPDGFLIEKRSARVAALPGKWHVAPSGSLQPPQSPWQTLLAESSEELALEPAEILEPRCVGMLFGEMSGVYQLACSARTPVRLSAILRRRRSGAWEQEGLFCAPVDPVALPLWLRQHTDQVTLGARAVLLAEGRRRWGPDWFEQHCEDRP
jgi:hypothetical protein